METKLKIQELWNYLGIQDNEVMIVSVYDQDTGKDMFIIAEAKANDLSLSTTDNLSDAISDRPFQLVQQRGSDGKFIIPSVKQMIEDKNLDY